MFLIETSRLVIQPLKRDDFPLVLEMTQNPKVMESIGSGIKSQNEAFQLFQKFLDHQNQKGFSLGSVRDKRTQEHLGLGGVIHYELNPSNPDIEIGHCLRSQFWGKGYATEIAIGCVNWAFSHLPIQHIIGTAHPNHYASQKVLLKAGLIPCGISTRYQKEVCVFKRSAPEPITLYSTPPDKFLPIFDTSACYVIANGEILLLRRAYEKKEGGLWGIPGGKNEPDESPLNGVIRELYEETGLSFPPESFQYRGRQFIRKPSVDYVYHMFLLELESKPDIAINSEHLEWIWAAPRDALNLPLMAGAKHAFSAAGVDCED